MQVKRPGVVMVTALVAAFGWGAVGAGQAPTSHGQLVEPMGERGEAVFPAFEGWGPLKDGTTNVFLLGYFNRNKSQEPDVPIGPNNRIEPGGPDFGQPTHFHTGRQYGVFAIRVPKDFGSKRLTWTLTANGQTSTVSFWTNPPYWVDFYLNQANGNEPPVIRLSPEGRTTTGPPAEPFALTLNGKVGQPLPLALWAADKSPTHQEPARPTTAAGRGGDRASQNRPDGATATRPSRPAVIGGRVFADGAARGGNAGAAARRGDITVIWKKYRGPGEVLIADQAIALFNEGDADQFVEAQTTATFSEPGEYWLRAQVNDSSGDGGGGDQCCWTTTHVKVVVAP
jgi:hypothetical protein